MHRDLSAAGESGFELGRLDDVGNARRLVALHGQDLRYVHPRRCWLVWDGRRWAEDDKGEAQRKAKDVVTAMFTRAADESDDAKRRLLGGWATKSSNATRLAAMLEVARSEPEVATTGREFDRHAWKLTVLNGTVDLRTGELRPHQREDLITKLAPVTYDMEVQAPRWAAFLRDVTNGNAELAGYLQRAVGYALTGDTSEHVVFLLYGSGANGKSTFLETIRALLGDYARQTDFSTFLATRDDHIRPDLARLAGARFVTAVEAEEGRRFAEALVKQLTGGDTIAARRLYEAHFEFRPECKVFLATNHKPRVWGTDFAFWRRIRLIPFNVTIPPARQDPCLPAALLSELPGILKWALEGCWQWQAGGLTEPDVVLAATRAYHTEQDVVGDFLADHYRISADRSTTSIEKKTVFTAYETWCRETGNEPLSARRFNERLRERGIAERDSNGKRLWLGLEAASDGGPHGEDDNHVAL